MILDGKGAYMYKKSPYSGSPFCVIMLSVFTKIG